MTRFRLVTGGLALAAALAFLPAGSAIRPVHAASAHPASPTLRVGQLTVHPCRLGVGRATWCGSMQVLVAPGQHSNAKLTVSFGWVPATHPPHGGAHTVLAMEGGPGYPSTGTAADYARMLGPVLNTHNLLVVDQRGTGGSSPINCVGLQQLGNLTTTATFRKDVKACGAQLGNRSDRYGTAYVAGDLATVVRALNVGRVDYYGDSYGTYLGQSFLARYPHLLRSVTLDSAYEARALDPWYRTTPTTAHRAFNRVCRLSVSCKTAGHGSAWSAIVRLARRLRHRSFTGYPVGLDGHRHPVVVNETTLVNLVNDAGYDYQPDRDLVAAARAYLNLRDKTPLLRLWAEDIGWDDGDYVAPYSTYSDGDYFAVACTDYPQLFSMSAGRAARVKQLDASEAALPPRTFAPFTVQEWLTVQPYTETYDSCLDWPAPKHAALPPVPSGPMDPTHVPVFILNGALDSLTPPAGGAHIARQIGHAARAVVVPNTVHLVALDNPHPCGEDLVRGFIEHPAHLHTMSVSCIHHIPPIDAIGRYPRTVHAAQLGSAHVAKYLRRVASVATATVSDAAVRFDFLDGLHDQGLRGGTINYGRSHGHWVAHLNADRWTVDSSISGTVTFHANGLGGTAHVTFRQGHERLKCAIRWSATRGRREAVVHLAGEVVDVPSP